ncbi:MAG: polymerase nonessential primary-like sigma factor, partial [Pseudonocardiales bacterium]|nr:polymerase nonessential primary-like sigma factor [Pseudonocardiales bacterium]
MTQPATQIPAQSTTKPSTAKRRNAASHTLPGHRASRTATPTPNAPVELDELAGPTEAVLDEVNPVEATADLDEVVQAADLVRSYLNEIGKVSLLTAVEEVELSKRIEAGLYASHLLSTSKRVALPRRRELQALAADGETAKDLLLRA